MRPDMNIFKWFWITAVARFEAYRKRLAGIRPPWITLMELSFMNNIYITQLYRELDRVSQYLIRHVIYSPVGYDAEDMVFRILIFKIFNRISTWEALNAHFGEVSYKSFDFNRYLTFLNELNARQKIFSSAYMMSSTSMNGKGSKTLYYLNMLQELMKSGITQKILKAKSFDELFNIFFQVKGLGEFLAIQYSIDLNYSPLIDLDENSFLPVKPGGGTIRGLSKLFIGLNKDYQGGIKYLLEHQEEEYNKYGLIAPRLCGKKLPTAVSYLNWACEFDKITRILFSSYDYQGRLKRPKNNIKRIYDPMIAKKLEPLFLPPKWKLQINLTDLPSVE